MPLQEEPPPPLPPARRSWAGGAVVPPARGRVRAATGGGAARLRPGGLVAGRAGGRPSSPARSARASAAAPSCQRAGPRRCSRIRCRAPNADPGVCLRPGGSPGAPADPAAPCSFVCLSQRRRRLLRGRDPARGAGRKLARAGGVAPRAEPRCQGARERSAVGCAGACGGCNFLQAQAPRRGPARCLPGRGGAASPLSVPAALAGAQGFPRPLVTLPLPFGPLFPGPAFPAGPGGAMERPPGRLRNAFSGWVLESGAPGGPPNCGVRGRGPRAEPRAPGGDRAGAPHPAPKLPPCPGGAFLRSTSHPEERRALGVRPEPASSTLAAPGQPRDSARWMLCVAGAKLKVSGGVWA